MWDAQVVVVVKKKVLAAQSCPALCDPMDYSPPVSSVHGILQGRILEWVTISFSRGWIFPTYAELNESDIFPIKRSGRWMCQLFKNIRKVLKYLKKIS